MFCPKCGSEIPNKAKFCPFCGEVIENTISLLKSTPITSDGRKEGLTISLSGGNDNLILFPNMRARFHVILQNNSSLPIYNVDLHLYGPPEFTMLISSKKIRVIGRNQTKNVFFTVLPEELGDFNLTVDLRSDIGEPIVFPIKVKVETRELVGPKTRPYEREMWASPTRSSSSGSSSGTIMALVIVFLIGIFMMVGGGFLIFRSPSAGISLLVVGLIFLCIGSKGKCLFCAAGCDGCGDCDCDC